MSAMRLASALPYHETELFIGTLFASCPSGAAMGVLSPEDLNSATKKSLSSLICFFERVRYSDHASRWSAGSAGNTFRRERQSGRAGAHDCGAKLPRDNER